MFPCCFWPWNLQANNIQGSWIAISGRTHRTLTSAWRRSWQAAIKTADRGFKHAQVLQACLETLGNDLPSTTHATCALLRLSSGWRKQSATEKHIQTKQMQVDRRQVRRLRHRFSLPAPPPRYGTRDPPQFQPRWRALFVEKYVDSPGAGAGWPSHTVACGL